MDKEQAYLLGARAAWRRMLQECLVNLGYEQQQLHSWVEEREGAISALREVCQAYGDNDWTEELHLEDIIRNHLTTHLDREQCTRR